jgi:hypothetical protein
MITLTTKKSNKYGVRVGDVYMIREKDSRGPQLFLVKQANVTVSDFACHVGTGHSGTIFSRSGVVGGKFPPMCITLGYITGRKYMNEQIESGAVEKIAHYDDLDVAATAICAWAEHVHDTLHVPVASLVVF